MNTSHGIKQPGVSGLNKAKDKTGIDVRATKRSDTLRNMKKVMVCVFFIFKTRRHNKILLAVNMFINVKPYMSCNTKMLALFTDIGTNRLVLFELATMMHKIIFYAFV